MTTGEKIKMLREQRGYTLEELGKRVGVGKSTVRKWETGAIENMGRDKIARLSEVFGVSPTYLINDDEEMPDTQTSAGHREEEYEETKDNVLRDYVMKAYSLHPENFQKLKEYLELLVLSQRDQDD